MRFSNILRKSIDLRSDTVTMPCIGMRKAMSNAKVGDDVFGDDPTVNKLEEMAAELFGKQSALGTMGNLISIAAHCRRGEEMIVGDNNHIFLYEGAGASAYLGVGMHTICNDADGSYTDFDIQGAIRDDDPHFPKTSLLAIENSHNNCGGRVFGSSKIQRMRDVCDKHNIKLHLDGARVANASVALNEPFHQILAPVDTVSICMSKGLGAPVGSIIAGSEEFIYNARRLRKSLGGGMRQSGILAAAAIFALENNVNRLAIDHTNAKYLAKELVKLEGVGGLDVVNIDTNIVYFTIDPKVMHWQQFVDGMANKGIKIGGGYGSANKIRAVIHKHISEEDVTRTIQTVKQLFFDNR